MIPVAPIVTIPVNIPQVPFYSQFEDITPAKWQKIGCGITSLAMIIDYYVPDAVSVDALLERAVASGAYQYNAGWKHHDMVLLSQQYGLDGDNYDLSMFNKTSAFDQFKDFLKDGPAIASVHYKFDPKSTIPHLVVIDGIDGDMVYYNDPAAKGGEKKILTSDFLKAWKKRFIVIRPAGDRSALLKEPHTSVATKKVTTVKPAQEQSHDVAREGSVEMDEKLTIDSTVIKAKEQDLSIVYLLKDWVKRFIVTEKVAVRAESEGGNVAAENIVG